MGFMRFMYRLYVDICIQADEFIPWYLCDAVNLC